MEQAFAQQRWVRRLLGLLVVSVNWGGSPESWGASGALTQLAAPMGCIAEGGDGVTCTAGVGFDSAESVAVSPDGKHVYVAATFSSAVTVFTRNKTTGALTQLAAPMGCIAEGGDGVTCTAGVGLFGASSVVVSPDGKHVYVAAAGSSAVTMFTRDKATGALTQLPAPASCIADEGDGVTCTDGVGLARPFSVAVSPDGKHVYVAAQGSSAVTVFTRDKATGALTQLPAPASCIANEGDGVMCTDGVGLDGAQSVAVSPDGKHVYVAAQFSHAVTVFTRNKTTGALTQLPPPAGCIATPGDDGVTCTNGAGFFSSVTVSPDGKHVYVAAVDNDAVVIFARNKTTGALTQVAAPTGCIANDGSIGGMPCTAGVGLDGAISVTVSPNGKHVYVASLFSDAVIALTRNKTTGALTQLPAPAGCIANEGDGVTCTDGVGLNGALSVAVSPDGKHVYATANAVTVFTRQK